MVKTKLVAALLLFCPLALGAQTYTWTTVQMDGSRCGTSIPTTENIKEAIGTVDNGVYTAPNGKKYKKGSVVEVARLMLDAQPAMAPVKEYVGYSPKKLNARAPQSELSNMIVDALMAATEKEVGRKVDVGVVNFGGIRVPLEEGDIVLDNIISMLPFVNHLCYVSLKGSDLREFFERSRGRVPAVGGVEIVVEGRTVKSVKVGGEPVDDNKLYGVATIDFLLNGGDGMSLGKNAQELIITDVLIRDSFVAFLRQLTAEGKPLEYHTDNRVQIL